MPKTVEMPQELAEEGYKLSQGESFVMVRTPDGAPLDKFSLCDCARLRRQGPLLVGVTETAPAAIFGEIRYYTGLTSMQGI